MDQKKAKDRIEKLKKLIDDYRYVYHVLNESLMSEEAADSLKHELSELESLYPNLITPDSPTQRVAGEVLKGFKEVRHQTRMLSLRDVFNMKEVYDWEERNKKIMDLKSCSYFVDLKMDGLACSLVYTDGYLELGVSRGDGFVGEDITANIKTIMSIPLKLRKTSKYAFLLEGRTEIRGEIIMYLKDFEELNKKQQKLGLKQFANPRNTAAGTIRQLNPKIVSERKLYFRAYDLIRSIDEIKTVEEEYLALNELGFIINKESKKINNLKELESFIDKWQDKRKTLEFNTDGLVVKINDRKIYQDLGVVGKAPRAAIAYKFVAEESTTVIKDIFVSIGRTGVATPVAILKPVVIAGTTVQMATLHNLDEIRRKDLRIGDSVIVHKAGDIIPEVVKPLKELRNGLEKTFQMPKNCPDCKKPLTQNDEVAFRCTNNSCPSRTYKKIVHFASKSALDIEGLGEKNVIALLDNKLINDQADIFSLKASEVAKLERFGELSASNLINAINDSKNPDLARFIYSLGIRHVGSQTAEDLANKFKTLDNLVKAQEDELNQIEGVGAVVSESIVEWFSEPQNQTLLQKFKDYQVIPKTRKNTANLPLLNTNFVITGTLETMDREEAATKIRELGGTFQSSVGKTTTYLVTGKNTGSSKLQKAKELGIKIISEKTLMKTLQDKARLI